MSGWIILFALLALTGTGLAAFQTAARATAYEAMGVVFIILLIIALLMRALRSRA
jgi:hypothetical protein